ncbi:Uncharacterised protein [Chromobacterium violaceum]|uniref:Uncharacterized protein n=1 Tax=Chromobacterium violaceum TaxID=536 RepID=A0A447TIT1_CHRVL|nr:Uncharacterised protein [Chromobacterium violaceum]
MKSLFWCALLCAAALVPAADKPAWRLVADANFEPYSYLSEDLARGGWTWNWSAR